MRHVFCLCGRRTRWTIPPPSRLEDTIRTISVGLMALAAMMVSFSVARQRSEPRREELQPPPGRAHAPSPVNLEAIRSAGF